MTSNVENSNFNTIKDDQEKTSIEKIIKLTTIKLETT